MKWIKKEFGSLITFSAFLIVMIFIVMAVAAPIVAPYNPSEQSLAKRLLPPSWVDGGNPEHLLGTDDLGRDVLSRIIYGSRASIAIGVFAAILSGIIGTIIGLISGYYKALDSVFMRIADIQLAFPSILLALAIVAIVGGSFWNLVFILGVTGWVSYARVIRSEVLSIKTLDYVIAAQTMNIREKSIIFRHIFPNLVGSAVTISTFQIASAIITEASLTFLGLGIPVTIPTWGNMLQDGQLYIETAWWMSVYPGLCILLVVLSVNLLGDLIRDKTDPQLNARRAGK